MRDAALRVSVVFYMHVPFPTSQIFRSLPAANELLQSITCADVVVSNEGEGVGVGDEGEGE